MHWLYENYDNIYMKALALVLCLVLLCGTDGLISFVEQKTLFYIWIHDFLLEASLLCIWMYDFVD